LKIKDTDSIAASLQQAAAALAACSRPALAIGAHSTIEQLSSALDELVSTAEFFGCRPVFWRRVSQAAELLDRPTDAAIYRARCDGLDQGDGEGDDDAAADSSACEI
jgi:hypothetical protein